MTQRPITNFEKTPLYSVHFIGFVGSTSIGLKQLIDIYPINKLKIINF